jgi:hypothetical protein
MPANAVRARQNPLCLEIERWPSYSVLKKHGM